MPLYTVLAPPPRAGAAAPDPLGFVFVKDGFCWPALFVPELWLLYRRMWLVFLLYLAVALGLSVLGSRIGGPLPWVAIVLAHLLFALEGNALRMRTLLRRGYDFIGVVEGRRREVELRFFVQWQPPVEAAAPSDQPPAETPAEEPPPPAPQTAGGPPKAGPWRPSAEDGDVVGLFPAPGGRA